MLALCRSSRQVVRKKGLFRNMPYQYRVVLVMAALLFLTGQIAGAVLKLCGWPSAWLSCL
jgi:hypothetical protein